jgi:phosphoribosylglycinamide formyltransferase-1
LSGARPQQQRLGLGFLASHGGSNMQAVIDACREGRLDAEPRVVISNNSRSWALRRAADAGIPHYHMSTVTHPDDDNRDRAMVDVLERHGVDLVVLGGYMRKLGPETITRFRGRIVNVHPALLPRFGGRGFYGIAVHEAVLASGEGVTGATIHLVDEQIDHGPVLAQRRVAVEDGDTAESLAERVLAVEHSLYVDTLRRIASGEIDLDAAAVETT